MGRITTEVKEKRRKKNEKSRERRTKIKKK